MDELDEAQRRTRLHQLDNLLEALEQLNLRDSDELPERLREQLAAAGIEVSDKANVSGLIERVWELQEHYLHPAAPAENGGHPAMRGSRLD